VEGRGGDGLGEEISASSSVFDAKRPRFMTGSSIAVLPEAPSFLGEARIRAFRGEDMARIWPCQPLGEVYLIDLNPRSQLLELGIFLLTTTRSARWL
jgi:hypothetical protein